MSRFSALLGSCRYQYLPAVKLPFICSMALRLQRSLHQLLLGSRATELDCTRA